MNFPVFIRAHYRLILVTTFLTVTLTYILTRLQTPLYKASTYLEINPEKPAFTGNQEDIYSYNFGRYTEFNYRYKAQVTLLQSQDFASAAFHSLSNQDQAYFRIQNPSNPAGAFYKNIDVNPTLDSNLLEVSVLDRNAYRAARLTTAYVRFYQEKRQKSYTHLKEEQIQYLTQRLQILNKEYTENLKSLISQCEILGLYGCEEYSDWTNTNTNTNTNTLKATIRIYDERLSELAQWHAVAQSVYEIFSKTKQRAGGFEKNYPTLASFLNRLFPVPAAKSFSTLEQMATFFNTLTQTSEQTFQTVVDQLKKEFLEKRKQWAKLDPLWSQVEMLRQTIFELNQRVNILTGTKDIALTGAEVILEATPPLSPSSPRPKVNMLLALFGGILLGFLVGYFQEGPLAKQEKT